MDILKEAERAKNLAEPSAARVFLEFKYPEMKDLLKHFLTLISASLVFSVTFSEKIVDFATASIVPKVIVIAAWGTLILALGVCGIGIFTLYLTATSALESVMHNSGSSYERLQKTSYVLQDLSGLLFGVGLSLLVVAAAWKVLH
jgi:hypothetical protein